MSFVVVFGVLTFIALLVSQFGGVLAARKSTVWWLIFVFLIVSALQPELLSPLAQALGINLPSNLFFSVMILFLVFQVLQESASTTRLHRSLRQLVSQHAAKDFLSHVQIPQGKKTLVVIPCYNEERAIPKIIPELNEIKIKHPNFIFCAVNDGSVDQSQHVLKQIWPNNHAQHSINIGVSGVLLTGFIIAQELDCDYVIQFDGDGQHPSYALPLLVDEAEKSHSDLLIASRYLKASGKDSSSTIFRYWGSLLIRISLKTFLNANSISDPTSGLRLYSKKAFTVLSRNLPDEYPEPESIALVALKGLKISEIPVAMEPRREGTSSLAGFKSCRFMIKVLTALLGLRMRSLFWKNA